MKKELVVLLAGIALFGCSTSDDDCPVNPGNNEPVEITFNTGVEGVKTTRTVVNENTPINAVFVASSTPGNYSSYLWSDTVSFNASATTSAAFSFTPKRYYPSSNSLVYIKGYYPISSTPTTNNIVSFNSTDGSTDVLLASQRNGSRQTSSAMNFTFNHLLSQLQFKFVAGANFPAGKTVTSLVIKNAQTYPTQLNLNVDTLTYSTNSISFTSKAYSIGSSSNSAISDTPMVAPGKSIVLSITTSDGVTYPDLTVGVTTVVGESHLITVTFNVIEITATVTVTAWQQGTGGNSTLQ